ncbi:MAG: glycohydrolase toxin TNT-related protein [Prevotella sp.]|nr:glycohydrolase toxin TNT-related protein [Prevotella sp.]
MAFAAGVAAAVCAFIPGPGWIVAAIIAAAVIAGLIIAGGKCAAAAATRYWDSSTVSQRSKLNGAHLLTLSSQMICPAQGGIITAEPTFWSAWGTHTLTNLGHVSNFAFGFLVGKGCANMAIGAGSAAAGASTAGEAVTTFGKTFAKDFAMTAKDNFVQQFTGWNQGGLFSRFMKGFGLYGEVKAHYDIWTDDEKSTWEKVKESGMSLILDVFAAKGATTVCFPAGTKVHTQWGLADIEKLEIGVPVLTYNEETGEQEYKRVKKVMRRMTRRMCALELSNGSTIEVTPEHRFFSNGVWTPIEELNVNDTLQLKDNSIVVIENKIIFPTFVEVYNLEIEDNENYYVTEEGVLVHNGCVNNKPQKPTFEEFKKSVEPDFPSEDIAEQSFELFKKEKWGELEDLFKKYKINGGYPPNDGAVSTINRTMKKGERFDRFGGREIGGQVLDGGSYGGKVGTPYEKRALPKGSDTRPYRVFEVTKDIPNVKEGKIIPWFGQEGGGIQYKLPGSIDDLIQGGFIKLIN